MKPELHGLLAIDKPRGWTSHDIVSRVRRLLSTKRIGHAGTLDPAAEGVLILGVGRATKLLNRVQDGEKEYIAHVILGMSSDSADAEGLAIPPDNVERPTQESVDQTLTSLTGEIDQVPPAYSAIKQGGEALYKKVRRGEDVDVPTRRVIVHQTELLAYDYPDLILRIRCGTGVYIRSIAHDLGEMLGCGGYLHYLLRSQVGGFQLADCWNMEDLAEHLSPATFPLFGLHPDRAVDSSSATVLNEQERTAWYHGQSLTRSILHSEIQSTSDLSAYDIVGNWCGIGEYNQTRTAISPRFVIGS